MIELKPLKPRYVNCVKRSWLLVPRSAETHVGVKQCQAVQLSMHTKHTPHRARAVHAVHASEDFAEINIGVKERRLDAPPTSTPALHPKYIRTYMHTHTHTHTHIHMHTHALPLPSLDPKPYYRFRAFTRVLAFG